MIRSIHMLAVAGLVFAGCGDGSDGLPRRQVSGTVTLDGQPLGEGSIVFVPAGSPGEATGGTIKDGAFTIPVKDGPTPGSYSVSVFSRKSTGKKLPDPNDENATIDEGFESIPPRYNAKTELKAEVAEAGDNHFDFKLEGALISPPKGGRSRP